MAKRLLPESFLFGATSSAVQIEGGAEEGGRTPSIWDKFCSKPSVIADASNAEDAADHYNRYAEDLLLMKRIRLQSYNFSVSWSRVLPNGIGTTSDRGMDFYDRLIDGILEQGIDPWITLNHWDLPLVMEDRGGWVKRDNIWHFADYAQKLAARLGDRVKNWITHNDPRSQAYRGYATGELAPGEQKPRDGWIASHHLLLSHSLAAEALRSEGPMKVGLNLKISPAVPASDSDADHRAAREWDGREQRWYLDALFKGEYPEDIIPLAKAESGTLGLDWIQRGDMKIIRDSLDFLGVNYYARTIVHTTEKLVRKRATETIDRKYITDSGLEVAPEYLTEALLNLQQYAPKEIFISENGAAYGDAPNEFGRISDHRRSAYISRHLEAIREAIDKGVNVKGYFVRSLLDGFEWTEGYGKRYGLIWVDFETQERIFKDSAHWYSQVIDTRDHEFDPSFDYRE